MNDPIEQFNQWWREALANSPFRQKSAACVSTIDQDGFPNARFVDLKAVTSEGFVFCSYQDSRKGKEITRNPKVAITIWWEHVGYQVRIVGNAKPIAQGDAEKYWAARSREAQLATYALEQSQAIDSEAAMRSAVQYASQAVRKLPIQKPDNWGGYVVTPSRIEFLAFREDRLHLREEFTNSNAGWEFRLLQP